VIARRTLKIPKRILLQNYGDEGAVARKGVLLQTLLVPRRDSVATTADVGIFSFPVLLDVS
jgi:hypothetical protein